MAVNRNVRELHSGSAMEISARKERTERLVESATAWLTRNAKNGDVQHRSRLIEEKRQHELQALDRVSKEQIDIAQLRTRQLVSKKRVSAKNLTILFEYCVPEFCTPSLPAYAAPK